MSDNDSDGDVSLVRVSSARGFKVAQDDVEYKIILKPGNNNKVGLVYTLKKGQELPYTPELEGKISLNCYIFNLHF